MYIEPRIWHQSLRLHNTLVQWALQYTCNRWLYTVQLSVLHSYRIYHEKFIAYTWIFGAWRWPLTPSSAVVKKVSNYTSTPPMGRTACTEPQCLYSRAIPLLPLWALQPVQNLSACTRMNFTFFYPYEHALCEVTWLLCFLTEHFLKVTGWTK
jgi:hypothetical protein